MSMIAETLISDELWADAPEDPERAFLFISQGAYRRFKFIESHADEQGPYTAVDWRRQYVYEVATVAEQLGIPGLMDADTAVQNSNTISQFDAQLARVVTRLKAANRSDFRTDSVTLSFQTKQDIRSHLEELREKINQSNLSDTLRASLHKKVDAVEAELDKSRSSLTPFWALTGALAMAGCTAVGTLADLPDALKVADQIVGMVHSDRADEERAKDRLSQPRIENKQALQLTHQPETDAGSQKRKRKSV